MVSSYYCNPYKYILFIVQSLHVSDVKILMEDDYRETRVLGFIHTLLVYGGCCHEPLFYIINRGFTILLLTGIRYFVRNKTYTYL